MTKQNRSFCFRIVFLLTSFGTPAIAKNSNDLSGKANTVGIKMECLQAGFQGVCWLKFSDGTRCVVSGNASKSGTATAIDCQFSTMNHRTTSLNIKATEIEITES